MARASQRGRAKHPIEVRWASGAADLRGAVSVREEVFCVEQGVPKDEELDGLDDQAFHLVAVEPNDAVIGTLRLLIVAGEAKIGRVAVKRRWRRQGVASRMLKMALADARARGCRRARLASQLQATGLYEEAGFSVESEPFEEAGIPHVWMARALGASA
jgi:predicted GNAT family N-acyltransferase